MQKLGQCGVHVLAYGLQGALHCQQHRVYPKMKEKSICTGFDQVQSWFFIGYSTAALCTRISVCRLNSVHNSVRGSILQSVRSKGILQYIGWLKKPAESKQCCEKMYIIIFLSISLFSSSSSKLSVRFHFVQYFVLMDIFVLLSLRAYFSY